MTRTEAVRTLTAADDGQTVGVRVGEVLAVELPVGGASGFAWAAADPTSGVLVREAGPDYAADPAAANAARIAGVAAWRYRAVLPGRATLAFAYGRAGAPPMERRTFHVVVAPAPPAAGD